MRKKEGRKERRKEKRKEEKRRERKKKEINGLFIISLGLYILSLFPAMIIMERKK